MSSLLTPMALQSPNSSPSSSSFSYAFTYHVFLSFRGTDTRYGFTGNLHKALTDKEIITFIDDRDLQGGDEITPALFKAIEGSRIAIPIFSVNYASSSFCLDELVHIMKFFKANNRLVLPIFYHVDPSHVRHQTKRYGKALAKREEEFRKNKENYADNMKRLCEWKNALNQATKLSGQHINLGSGYESEVIGNIVKYVSNKINRAPLHVADYPVGLQSRVLKVNSLLDVGSDDKVHMLGIYGTGGIGKSTLARATYNSIADKFECLCFLDDVREKSIQHGLVYLQETLLYETTRENEIKLGSAHKGIPIIKQMLHRKKVLLILDDIDKLKQLQVLAGGLDWFGPGSRVIVTTRDKHLLASHGIERTHEANELNEEEALELLRWNAFKNDTIDSNYEEVLNRVVYYASGLPLALEVVGSDLFGKCIKEWKSKLDRYKRIPSKEIQRMLKVSFDALEEDEQNVFLDIACCFKRYDLGEVENILQAHYGQCMKYHIGVLVDKSLIKIDKYQWSHTNYITLHDLIEDMGKEIIRQQSPKDPGKRSRLWFHKDIVQVLEDNMGTSQIEIIYLDFPSFKEEVVEWKGDELKKMKNLKTLIIKSGRFSKGPGHFPNSLRVLEWHEYPSGHTPFDFCPTRLSICKLQNSGLTSFQLCGSLKRFVNLREINLDNCQYLTEILDVSSLRNLEIFSFCKCRNLLTVHDSVGFLKKLKILGAEGCIKLESFPPLELSSLQQLELAGCTSLASFPEILAKMENITDIYILDTPAELPLSFQNLIGLQRLSIDPFPHLNLIRGHAFTIDDIQMTRLPSSILMLPKLSESRFSHCCLLLPKHNDKLSSMVSTSVQKLQFNECKLSDEFLAVFLKWFPNIEELNLSKNNFTILPECLKECHFLRRLRLDNCKCLQEIRGIPPNLKHLSATGCKSLTSSCRRMLSSQELHEAGSTVFSLAGTERIPKWFEHQSKGRSITFWFRNEIPSVALFFSTESMHNKFPINKEFNNVACLIINGYRVYLPGYQLSGLARYLFIEPNHTYLLDLKPVLQRGLEEFMKKEPLKNEWIHVEITYEEWNWGWGDQWERTPFSLKSGIHIFKQKSSMEDVQFTNPSSTTKKAVK